MRIAVGDVPVGSHVIGLIARQVRRDGPGAGQREQFPMGARLLGVASDENVIPLAAIENGATGDRQRASTVLVASGDQPAGLVRCRTDHGDRSVGLGHRCARVRLLGGGITVELRHQPGQAVEVVLQPRLGVVLRVSKNPDRAAISAVANHAQHLQIERSMAELQDLLPMLVAVAHHSVKVDTQQMGQHLW